MENSPTQYLGESHPSGVFVTCFVHVHIHKHRGTSESWLILPFDLLFISAQLRPKVSGLKPQETSSVSVDISNTPAPLALKVRDGLLPPGVRPGLLRTAQEFLRSFGELFTVLE